MKSFICKLKKISVTAIALTAMLTAIISMPSPSYAVSENVPHSWYVKRNSDNTLPRCESNLEFIKKYNAFYGDEKAAQSADKVIYLTFDAGYENGNVEKILNVLKKNGVPGAFFVLENLVNRNPELIKRMASEGHLVCNHTKKHPDMTKITDKSTFAEQLNGLSSLIKEKCGVDSVSFYRPPEGKFSEQNLRYASELGYKTVFWSFAYADWDNNHQPSEQDAIKKILSNAHPGEIMLLHPTSKTNAAVLDNVISALKADGYRFGSLSDICL